MQIQKKFIKFGTGSTEVNANVVPANFASPSNYTPASSTTKGHLEGIDSALAGVAATTGDIGHTSFSLADNQSSPANVTALAFANGTVRSAEIQYSIVVDATTDLYESGSLFVIQKGSSWDIARDFNGDDSLVQFDIDTAGQVTYTTPTYSGFSSAVMKFRAKVTQV